MASASPCLEDMDYHQPPCRERYPALAELDRYYGATRACRPKVSRNIIRGKDAQDGTWLRIRWFADPKLVEAGGNFAGEDPRFIDEEHMNFQLSDDSPAWRIGFERIPFEQIGLQLDENRKRLPGR